MRMVNEASLKSPDGCKTCCWENVCGGNMLVSRYSKEKGFNNPSTYCSGLKTFYGTVAKYLVKNGMSIDKIQNTLLPSR